MNWDWWWTWPLSFEKDEYNYDTVKVTNEWRYYRFRIGRTFYRRPSDGKKVLYQIRISLGPLQAYGWRHWDDVKAIMEKS